jgi:hypothetical protein
MHWDGWFVKTLCEVVDDRIRPLTCRFGPGDPGGEGPGRGSLEVGERTTT